jgi:hypothetical protein
MAKMNVKKIEDFASALMSGMHIPSTKKISILYYYILEDANYHSLNTQLTKNGNYGEYTIRSSGIYVPKSYGSDYAEYLFKKYREEGGRTWNL